MRSFLIALQFLTIFPVKIKGEIKEKEFGKSLIFFPLIGTIIGIILFLTLFLVDFLPDLVRSTFILGVSILITGGIHLDGFADTFDGFYGFKTKEERLNILRDSKIGVIGAISLFFLLLFKFVMIVSIKKAVLWKTLIIMPTYGRWNLVLACYFSQYPREQGKAKYFIENSKLSYVISGKIFTLFLFLFLFQLNGIILFVLPLPFLFLFIYWSKKKIGGMTGDTLGAMNEISECLILLFSLLLNKN